jgi:hypothetical protein
MFNLSKIIEDELQYFKEFLVLSASQLRPHVEESNVDVRIKCQFNGCKIDYINKIYKENFNKFVYYQWIQQSIVFPKATSQFRTMYAMCQITYSGMQHNIYATEKQQMKTSIRKTSQFF